MKLRILTVMAFVMLAGPVFAQQTGQDSLFEDDRFKYVVRRGDTLWDLAARFMDNPYDWPMIWQHS